MVKEIVARDDKESHLDTIYYEIRTLRYAFDWIQGHWDRCRDQDRRTALLESYLLHYRNLAQFFASRGRQTHLQFRKGKVWAGRALTEKELAAIGKPGKQVEGAHASRISIYLSHCTPERFTQPIKWEVGQMNREIEEVISEFVRSFPTLGEQCRPSFPRALRR